MPDLNPPQRAAVNTLSGPLLVLAGAGSGKTRVITYRIAKLIKHGIAPNRILAVTFTNKAAREMKQRATSLLGRRKRIGGVPEISTFHSLCVRILRRRIELLGYPSDFSIYDSSDQEGLARNALRDIRVGDDSLRPGDLLSIIGNWKTQSIGPSAAEDDAKNDRELLAARAFERYQDALKARGAVDFDDLLLLTERLFADFEIVRREEARRFDHLLVDEYQDTNGPQYRIVRELAAAHRNLCVVGDDDQSIYAWRGAEVSHILNFKNDWPEAKIVYLEDNYRSQEPILNLANVLIKHNSDRHPKVLKPYRKGGDSPRIMRFDDETAEATSIVADIRSRMEESCGRIRAGDFAILFRTNEQPRAFEVELRRAKVPYKLVGGSSFYDRKEVRDILGYLRVVARPHDEASLLRIINTPPRGIGATTIQNLVALAVSHGTSVWEALPHAFANGTLSGGPAGSVREFRRMVLACREQLGKKSLAELARELMEAAKYKEELERVYPTAQLAEARGTAIESVINQLASYEERADEPTLQGFIEEMTLSDRDQNDKDDKQPQVVTLMTLHSAKGLEFPHVYMVGMEEGLLPHKRSVLEGGIGEERRLAYVGVTRAQDTLCLTFCKARMKWGKLRPQIPSRFLMEMKGDSERAQKAATAARQMLEAADQAMKDRNEAAERTKKAKKKTRKKASKRSASSRSGPPPGY